MSLIARPRNCPRRLAHRPIRSTSRTPAPYATTYDLSLSGLARGRHRPVQRNVGDPPARSTTQWHRRDRGAQSLGNRHHARSRRISVGDRHGRGGHQRHPQHTRELELEQRIARRRHGRTRPTLHVQPGPLPSTSPPPSRSVVNEPRHSRPVYTVTNPTGNVVFTSPATNVSVNPSSSVVPVDLGSFDHRQPDGWPVLHRRDPDRPSPQPLPTASGQGSLTIGLPLTASLTLSPNTLPTGSGAVTDTLQINSQTPLPNPLTLVGGVGTPAPGTTVALFGTDAYVGAPAASRSSTSALHPPLSWPARFPAA